MSAPVKLDYDTLLDALDKANIGEEAVREDYSGRGMYGERCLAVVVGGDREMFTLVAALGVDLARRARSDSMGLGMVVYFVGVEVER